MGSGHRIYLLISFAQAVIDARTLLAQILITPTLGPNNPFNTSFDKEVNICKLVVQLINQDSHFLCFFLVARSPVHVG